jgi:hypothetical protein
LDVEGNEDIGTMIEDESHSDQSKRIFGLRGMQEGMMKSSLAQMSVFGKLSTFSKTKQNLNIIIPLHLADNYQQMIDEMDQLDKMDKMVKIDQMESIEEQDVKDDVQMMKDANNEEEEQLKEETKKHHDTTVNFLLRLPIISNLLPNVTILQF